MKKMPKVAIVATSRLTRGGVTSVINAHSDMSFWRDWNCTWIETHIDGKKIDKLIYAFRAVIKFIFSLSSYDIIHVHLSEPSSLIRKSLFVFLAKMCRKKVVIHFHSFSIDSTIKSKFRYIYQLVFNSADIIIVLSPYWKNSIEKVLKITSEIEIVYNPCIRLEPPENLVRKNIILFAGTICDRKGYQDLILAFSRVKSTSHWELHLAGNGDIDKGKELARDLGIYDRVKFLGWLSGANKSKAFFDASIFCLPSYAEGFPMALLDSISYGITFVTTSVGGTPDVFENGVHGYIYEPGDIDQLSKSLSVLMNDEKLRFSLNYNSQILSQELFLPEVIDNKIKNIYQKLLLKSV